jgi:Protein of unknown function (DUF2877)
MKNSNQRLFKTTSIGLIASGILSKDQEAHVFGKTSKGVFIKTSGKWLIFLSFEQFRGPLTITFDKIDPIFQHVSGGDPIQIASQSIFIPGLEVTISMAGRKVWQPPLPTALPLGDPERHEQLVYCAKEIMSKKNGVGLGSLIPLVLEFPNAQPAHKIITNFDWAYLQRLQNYIRNKQAAPLARLLATILGSGPGLTPSADDFIVGLLLALNRWQSLLWTADSLRDLNLKVVEAAYEKTTTLSANLIECATLRLANERLINILDWLVTGAAREPKIVTHLLEWGNSSGVDAFTGMAVALTI